MISWNLILNILNTYLHTCIFFKFHPKMLRTYKLNPAIWVFKRKFSGCKVQIGIHFHAPTALEGGNVKIKCNVTHKILFRVMNSYTKLHFHSLFFYLNHFIIINIKSSSSAVCNK